MLQVRKLTKHLLKMVYRVPIWGILLFVCCSIISFCFITIHNSETQLAMTMTAYGQLMLTLVFLLLGIQLNNGEKYVQFADTADAYSTRPNLLLQCKVLVIVILSTLATLLLIVTFVLFAMLSAPLLWIKQITLYCILLYWLPCIISGMAGIFWAQCCSSRRVYIYALVGWFLTTSLIYDYFEVFEKLGIPALSTILRMVNLGITNMRSTANDIMVPPIDLPRFIIRFSIILTLSALIFGRNLIQKSNTHRQKRLNRRKVGIAVICCTLCMVLCATRYWTFFTIYADPNARRTYGWQLAYEYEPYQNVSLTDFPSEKLISVTETAIDISFSTQGLSAEVSLIASVDQPTDKQAFTLYSEFEVDSVSVNGKRTSFERSHDGVLVLFPAAAAQGDTLEICFEYHGYSHPSFFANETSVQLHRAFPWLPYPGLRDTLVHSNFYSYDDSYAFFIEDWQRDEDVLYTLSYNGPADLYTNIPLRSDGTYSGTSSFGISLYSGMVHEVYKNIDVYVPAGQYKSIQTTAEGLLGTFEAMKKIAHTLSVDMPEAPDSVVMLTLNTPIILQTLRIQESELHSFGNDWEMWRTTSWAIGAGINRLGTDAYPSSSFATAAAISYFLTPSSGYPADALHSSTVSFSAWLYSYERLQIEDAPDPERYISAMRSWCSKPKQDFIGNEPVAETPITDSESEKIDQIIYAMAQGTDFDSAFADLYSRLMQEVYVSPSDFINTLYAVMENNG